MIGAVSAPIAILADALSFVGSALFVLGIRRVEPTPDRHRDADGRARGSLRAEIASGLRYVLGNRYLRSIAASTGWSNYFTNLFGAVFLLYVVRDLGLRAEQIGLIYGLGNLGAILAALSSTALARRLGLGRTVILGMAASGLALPVVPLAPARLALPALLLLQLVASYTAVVYNINQVSFRQAITPSGMQGRMNASMRFIVWGTIPLGALSGGALGEVLGVHETLWVGAIGAALAWTPLLVGPLRHLRETPAPADATETASEAITESEPRIGGLPAD